MTRNIAWLSADPVLALDENNSRLARGLGLPTRTVVRWRHGQHRMRLSTAERIADTLDMHPSELWPEYAEALAPCGTRRAYDAGCTCPDCRRWARERSRARRAALRGAA